MQEQEEDDSTSSSVSMMLSASQKAALGGSHLRDGFGRQLAPSILSQRERERAEELAKRRSVVLEMLLKLPAGEVRERTSESLFNPLAEDETAKDNAALLELLSPPPPGELSSSSSSGEEDDLNQSAKYELARTSASSVSPYSSPVAHVDDVSAEELSSSSSGYTAIVNLDAQAPVNAFGSTYNVASLSMPPSSPGSRKSSSVLQSPSSARWSYGNLARSLESVRRLSEVNWSETRLDQFHRLLAELRLRRQTTDQKVHLYNELAMMVSDFQDACESYARVIVTELHLPLSNKTIKPIKSAGVLGGEKFLVSDVFIKFATDKGGLMGGSDAAARKVASHEVKSLAMIAEANVEGLRYPLLTSVTCLGFTLLCMSRLPIDDSTLVYGSNDGGRTVRCQDKKALALAEKLGKHLNLKGHSPNGHPEVTFYTPVDFEIHLGLDGHYYCCDLSRLFPPSYIDQERFPGGHLYRLFRPEFLQTYSVPLNSDTFSNFIDPEEQRESVNEIAEASKELDSRITAFAAKLDSLEVPRGTDSEYAGRVLVVRMHVAGINVRFMGQLWSQVTSRYWRLEMLISMISRKIKMIYLTLMRAKATVRVLDCLKTFLNLMNLVFGKSHGSDKLWDDVIRPALLYYGNFFESIPSTNFKHYVFSEEHDAIFDGGQTCALRLFLEVTKRLSIMWTPSVLSLFKQTPQNLVSRASPFRSTDLDESLPVLVKHIPLGFYAGGKVKLLTAQNSSPAVRRSLFWGAAALFARAVDIIATAGSLRKLALCVAMVNERRAADLYFQLALEVDRKSVDRTYYGMARIAVSTHDYDSAHECFLRSLECAKMHPRARHISAFANFLIQRELVDAGKDFHRAALRLFPDHFDSLFSLGTCLRQMDPVGAENLLRLALAQATDLRSYHRASVELGKLLQSLERDDPDLTFATSKLNVTDNLPDASSLRPHFVLSTNSSEVSFEAGFFIGPSSVAFRTVSLDHGYDPDLEVISVEHAVKAKSKVLFSLLALPCLCEVTFLVVDNVVRSGRDFAVRNVEIFARMHLNMRARLGVAVAFRKSSTECVVKTGHIWGKIVNPRGLYGKGWDLIFEVENYNKTLAELQPALRAMIGFRREPYLTLLANEILRHV